MDVRTRYQSISDQITRELVEAAFARQATEHYYGDVLGPRADHSEAVRRASERSIAWARMHGAIDDAAETKFRWGRPAWLTMCGAPANATPEQLDLIADTTSWLFFVDDGIDTYAAAHDMDLARVRSAVNSFSSILRDPAAKAASEGDFAGLYAPICSLTRSISERLWRHETGRGPIVIDSLIEYLSGLVLEFCHTVDGTRLDQTSYLDMRLRGVAVRHTIEILLLVNGFPLPDRHGRDLIVDMIFANATYAVTMMNDLVSFRKEAASAGAVLNNIVSIQYEDLVELGIAPHRAATLAIERTVDRYRKHRTALHQLARWLAPEVDAEAFVGGVNNGLMAIVEWSINLTPRYR